MSDRFSSRWIRRALRRSTRSTSGAQSSGEERGKFPLVALNEAIRLDLNAIYVAIPKTGSTAIRQQFSHRGPFLLPAPHLTIRQLETLWHFWNMRESLHRNLQFPTNPKIVMSDLEVLEASEARFQSTVRFATVRNPFARTLSLWRRREGIQVQHEMTFHEFCDQLAYASDTCMWPTRNQCQVDWLTGWGDSTLQVPNVLRLENLAKDLEAFAKEFPQMSFLRNNEANVNHRSGIGRNYAEAYSVSARQAVELVFRRDLETFNYEF